MDTEHVASRIQLADGTEYYIGTRGSVEKVALKLTADTEVDWTALTVLVQDLSASTSAEIALSQEGECIFEIPHGNTYTITLPYIDGYNQPNALRYTASIAGRNVDYAYGVQYENLFIRVAVMSAAEGEDASIFNNFEVKAVSDSGAEYAGVIENAQVVIPIPFGTTYTIKMPDMDGLFHNHVNETFVAGTASRNLVYTYADTTLGVFGIDEDGNYYSTAQLEAMGVETAAALIKAVGLNTYALASAMRKDGNINCGFCWNVDTPQLAGAPWASANVDFGVNNTIVADAITNGQLSEGCGYYSSGALAYTVKDGAGESALVEQVGRVLADAMVLDQNNPTPAVTNTASQSLTIGGVTKKGFLPAYGQITDMGTNKATIDALYAALGKTFPNISSGNWWTSCQGSATQAVDRATAGLFRVDSKTNGYPVLCCFDL